MRYKVCICYDGTNYYGFQKQKDKLTIQSELERVLSKIFLKVGLYTPVSIK